ncbi:hypothetical protein PF010_g25395 [Phytophthora fragariae]|uniref:Uncharacterized protein n=1 Tax=Phytophthora fragariae TaxID=53985 RepID=A0A6G0JZZ2_9STRA|nr:hypothetical protein PF010_g25395 [Phytophthora fragariae]
MLLALLSKSIRRFLSSAVALAAFTRFALAKLASESSSSSSRARLRPTVSRKSAKSIPPSRLEEVA